MMHVCFATIILGCMGIGAWLVTEGHPWFAFFVMAIGGSVSMKHTDDNEKGKELSD